MFRYLSRKRWARLLFFLSALFLTTGCSQNDPGTASSEVKMVGGNDDKSSFEKPAAIKAIVIDNQRCTGCGKCSRFDPEHFSFNMTARKAIVISQENLESDNLRFAISACQDRAIALK